MTEASCSASMCCRQGNVTQNGVTKTLTTQTCVSADWITEGLVATVTTPSNLTSLVATLGCPQLLNPVLYAAAFASATLLRLSLAAVFAVLALFAY